MSSTIHNCVYDPAGKDSFNVISSLTRLQRGGAQDISYLLQEIVKEDFGYKGTEKYTLTLRNNNMVLEIWDRPDGTSKSEFGTLELSREQQWVRTPHNALSGRATILSDTDQTSNRVNHTLQRIKQAYEGANPGSIPSPHIASSKEGSAAVASTLDTPTTAPVVNNYVTCDHTGLTETMYLFQQTMEKCLGGLQESLSRLERSLPTPQPKVNESDKRINQLQEQIGFFSDKIEKLQQDIKQLKKENHDLKGLKEPLVSMSEGIPAALLEINHSIEQLKLELEKIPRTSSDNAQTMILTDMQSEIKQMHSQLKSLPKAVAPLQQELAKLQTENNALKEKDIEQQAELSLKDRQISDLTQKLQQQLETTDNKFKRIGEENKSRLSMLQIETEGLRQNEGKLKIQVQSLEEQNLKQVDELQKLTEKSQIITSVRDQSLEKLRIAQEKAQIQDELIKLQDQQLKASEQNEEELKIQIQELNEKIRPLENQLEVAKKQIQTHEIENQEIKKEIESINRLGLQDKEGLQQQYDLLVKKLKTENEKHNLVVSKITELSEQLEASEKEAARAALLTVENRELKQGLESAKAVYDHDQERIVTLQQMNTSLSADKSQLDQKILQLDNQLKLAKKTNETSQKTIQQLDATFKEIEKQIKQEKESTIKAKLTAQKTESKLSTLRSEFENQTSFLTEARNKHNYNQKLLAKKSETNAKILAENILLESDYNELAKLSKELEADQEERINELEKELTRVESDHRKALESLGQKVDPSALEAKHKLEIETLKQQLQDAQKKQTELTERAPNLHTNSAPTVDLRNVSLPPTRIEKLSESTSLEGQSDMVAINQTLENIQNSLQTLDDTVSPKWVGPIMINLAFLGDLPKKDTTSNWIQSKFANTIDANELQRIEASYQVHYQALKPPVYKESNARTVVGDLSKALTDPAVRALKNPKNFKNLESCFGNRLFIAQGLLNAKMKIKPIVDQYKILKDSGNGHEVRKAKFAEAEQFLTQIDAVLGILRTKLNEKKWKIKA